MKKNGHKEFSSEQIERLISLAIEEKNPFEVIKKEFNLEEKEVLELMKKKMSSDKYEVLKKKALVSKPKPKVSKNDEFDDDLDQRYYIKNKFD